MNSGTPVISKYGITKSQLLNTYIPALKKGLNGGYVFFLLYTITEGGGAGNWVNHYMSDTSSGGLACMKDDISYLNSLNKNFPVAKSAPEVLGGANFVEDKAGAVDTFYKSISTKSVGMLFMPSTLAGNAWVWATNWCLRNQSTSPPGVYFGNPYDGIIKTIKNLGGDPFGDDGGDDGGDDNSGGSTDSNGNALADMLVKAFEKFLDSIEDAMTWDMHSIGAEKFFSNSFFAMQKTFNNTYRLQMNTKLIDDMRDLIDGIDTGGNGDNTGDTDDKDDPSGDLKSVPPNGKNATLSAGPWTYDNIPKKYKDAIGVPKFDPKYLAGSPFVNTGDTGQCTELTWAYMHQIWKKTQPAWDNQVTNGQRVWEVYKAQGAKTTHSPTVGYGFSSKPPFIQAAQPGIGHTGVVVAVFDDGSFLTANYNIWPQIAPSRVVLYSLINGVPKNGGTNFMFFSGIGQK